ncbi:hypothetical protein [Aeromicrobium duanguangcaii]|uniref:Biopolymer transporter ExbD n=1 Tax=Aeromicrobium duanguangcaii TaxID=2968086 RepID=A0ABY5KJ38_9ACTN|nr:hypothetical protein [Aeromicrobium duanguangcaii]MCD9153116.1 hypothetical protein [Aeromicrobium duanguangcaii]UUI69783.1 hypothetical protein NP095_06730 [Aeromicrobium duanguangcaii]
MRVSASLSNGRRGRLRSTESLAGWVFADMLLVLFLIGLGTAVAVDPPEPEPEPEPVMIVGMKTDPISISIAVPADGLVAGAADAKAKAQKAVAKAIRRYDKNGNEAALVLIFGGAETAGPGQEVAKALRPRLTKASPDLFPRKAPSRFFWDGSLPYGKVRLEVFLFAKEETKQP